MSSISGLISSSFISNLSILAHFWYINLGIGLVTSMGSRLPVTLALVKEIPLRSLDLCLNSLLMILCWETWVSNCSIERIETYCKNIINMMQIFTETWVGVYPYAKCIILDNPFRKKFRKNVIIWWRVYLILGTQNNGGQCRSI